jgi:hypothetical protein
VRILDTTDLPARERAERVQATISDSASSSLASFENPATMWARLTLTDLGPGRVFTTESGGMTLRRTAKLARTSEEHRVALAVPLHGPCRLITGQQDAVIARREMLLVDLSEPSLRLVGVGFLVRLPDPAARTESAGRHGAPGRGPAEPLAPVPAGARPRHHGHHRRRDADRPGRTPWPRRSWPTSRGT